MTKPASRALILFVLLLGLAGPAAHAQTTGPADFVSFYQGAVVWQQPDGTTQRGTCFLDLEPTAGGKFQLLAQLDFPGSSTGAAPLFFAFSGKLDPNGRGFLKLTGTSVTTSPQTVPGFATDERLPVFVSHQGFATGGVLTMDGTQLTFRAYVTTTSEMVPPPGQ